MFAYVTRNQLLVVQMYLDGLQAEVDDTKEEIARYERDTNAIKNDVLQFNELNEKISKLDSRKVSLKESRNRS